MTNNKQIEDQISERAYQIWLEEGQPQGRDKEHWERAKAEIVSGSLLSLVDSGEGIAPTEGGINPDDLTR